MYALPHQIALIGCSGFVGSTLRRQAQFGSLYRSTNIGEIEGRSFDTIVCAGAPAQKWVANRDPEADRQNICGLIAHLRAVECKRFILISTVDVFKIPAGVDESTRVVETGLHPYGVHRRMLEQFVEERFPDRLTVRLPGLVGPGLRKNAIFDLLNENDLQQIESRGMFQFYPMVNLWADLQVAIKAGLSLVHLTAEPVRVRDVAETCFGRSFTNTLSAAPAVYDVQSKFADLFGGHGRYQYTSRETMMAIRAYAQSEPRTVKTERVCG